MSVLINSHLSIHIWVFSI